MKLWKMGYVELDDAPSTTRHYKVETVHETTNPYTEFLRVFVESSVDCENMPPDVKNYLKEIIGTKAEFKCDPPTKGPPSKTGRDQSQNLRHDAGGDQQEIQNARVEQRARPGRMCHVCCALKQKQKNQNPYSIKKKKKEDFIIFFLN